MTTTAEPTFVALLSALYDELDISGAAVALSSGDDETAFLDFEKRSESDPEIFEETDLSEDFLRYLEQFGLYCKLEYLWKFQQVVDVLQLEEFETFQIYAQRFVDHDEVLDTFQDAIRRCREKMTPQLTNFMLSLFVLGLAFASDEGNKNAFRKWLKFFNQDRQLLLDGTDFEISSILDASIVENEIPRFLERHFQITLEDYLSSVGSTDWDQLVEDIF